MFYSQRCFPLSISRFAILCLASTFTFAGAQPAQTVDSIDPAFKARIDQIAGGVMRNVESLLSSSPSFRAARWSTRRLTVWRRSIRQARYAGDALLRWFGIQAIHGYGDASAAGTGQALDRRPGRQIRTGLTRGNEVTIRQILSHTSGYQDYAPEDYPVESQLKPVTPREILDTWAAKPLYFEPGTQWQYSNTNYVIAGLIVEKVSGQKLFAFLGEHVFHPLGMTSAWNSDEKELTRSDAAPYMRNALGPLRPTPNGGEGWMFAAGELAMTAHDLALWDISLLARSVLRPETGGTLHRGETEDGKGTHYGLGVEVTERDGHHSIEHSGEVNGFVSDNEVLIDDGVAVAVLTNHMAGGAEEIARLAASTVVGGTHSPSEEQAITIYRGLQKGQIDRAVLAPNLSAYFDAQTLADYRDSLAPLGEPLTFHQVSEVLRGGMTFRIFRIQYPTHRLTLTTYTYPDGKLEQYLVEPAD